MVASNFDVKNKKVSLNVTQNKAETLKNADSVWFWKYGQIVQLKTQA